MNTKIRGQQIKDAFFGAGLVRNSGDADVTDVNVDDSSIEISSDALQVKDLGITNAMLAGSIANAKLVDIADSKLELVLILKLWVLLTLC